MAIVTVKTNLARFRLSIISMKPSYIQNEAIEVVQVRLFDISDGPEVIAIYQHEISSCPDLSATLYHNPIVLSDWSIYFWRKERANPELKSLSAIRCAETLRSIGLVDHAIWWLQATSTKGSRRIKVLEEMNS